MSLRMSMAILAAAALAGPALFAQTTGRAVRRPNIAEVISPAYLGIGVRDIDSERAKTLKLKEVRGAEITNVWEDSPAAKAGFKEGDVVLEYNGQTVEGQEQLSRLVAETPVGRQVKVVVSRNGVTQTLTPTVEARKGGAFPSAGTWVMPEIRIPEFNMPPMDLPRFEMTYQNPALGITGEPLGQAEQLAEYFGVKEGVLVRSVIHDSAAEKAGIKAGDVVVKVEDTKVANSREITAALRNLKNKKTVTVTVVRNRKEMPLTVTIEAATTSRAVRAGLVGQPFAIKPILVRPLVIKPLVIPRIRVLKFPAQDGVI